MYMYTQTRALFPLNTLSLTSNFYLNWRRSLMWQSSLSPPYVLERCSRIPVAQPQEYEYRIPPGESCI